MISYDYNIIEKVQCSKSQMLEKPQIYKREYLDLYLKSNGNKRALVIMMNPSVADNKTSDKTINKLAHYFVNIYPKTNNKNAGIINLKYMSIANLFSICCQKSSELNSYFDEISKRDKSKNILPNIISDNRKVIENKIIESDYIILGFGNCPDNFYETSFYSEVLNTIALLKKHNKNDIFVFHINNKRLSVNTKLTKRMNPVHPINGDIINILRVEIDSLNRIIV